MQHEKRDHHGKRNRKKDSCCSAETPQKNPNHYGGKENTDAAFAQDGGDRTLYEKRLVKDNVALELRRDIAKRFDGFFDSVHYGDGIGVTALLEDGNVNRFLSVDAHDIVLKKGAVNGFSNI